MKLVEKVPGEYIRKQTIKNAERYITADLKDYESRVLGAEEIRMKREAELFLDLRRRLGACSCLPERQYQYPPPKINTRANTPRT